jgi:ATP-dependent RNA helicase DeaD
MKEQTLESPNEETVVTSSPAPAEAAPAEVAPAEAAPAEAPTEPTADAAAEPTPDAEPVGRVVLTDYHSNRAFTEFPLSPEVLQAILDKGYTHATAVQAAAIEPALAGKDLVVRSKTGTGKTAAFSIPVVERIPAGDRKTRAIILAPTRELARQTGEECEALSKHKDIRVAVIYGGVGFGPQEDALKAGAEIVVGTPGRILDHLRRGNLKLGEATFAVLDEADEMLSMGFYEDVTKILDQTPESRQCLFFSATVDDRVRSLIRRYAKDPEDIRLSTDTDKVDGIAHILYETTPDYHKARALLAIIDQEAPKSAIIFCNTREDTATVATFLSRQGLDAELLSGELPQNKREQVMANVKKGATQYLVATDVAARGIDISDLSHVINYSLPEDPATYLHRTGRTGRIGKTGIAISLTGGAEIHTRNSLERQFQIAFQVKPLPTADEAGRAAVDRQARAIVAAMGTMAFEGYMPTVRALKERPDGDMLLAAALRAFFLWDRTRKAAIDGSPDSVGALQEARDEKRRERSEGDRDRGPRDRDRGPRDDRPRDRDRDRGPRDDRPRDDRPRDDRPRDDRPRDDRPRDDRPRDDRPRDDRPRDDRPRDDRPRDDRPRDRDRPRRERSDRPAEARSAEPRALEAAPVVEGEVTAPPEAVQVEVAAVETPASERPPERERRPRRERPPRRERAPEAAPAEGSGDEPTPAAAIAEGEPSEETEGATEEGGDPKKRRRRRRRTPRAGEEGSGESSGGESSGGESSGGEPSGGEPSSSAE